MPNYSQGFLCEDLNECSSSCSNDCDLAHATCVNLSGGFECLCNVGFSGTGKTGHCFDIDECTEIVDKCSANAVCMNTVGGFVCKCRPGFAGNGTVCEDINECVDLGMEKECSMKNSKCIDLYGSYECQCLNGYFSNTTSGVCVDIDECIDESACDGGGTVCLNVPGSFICECGAGFRWSAVGRLCEDIDECVASRDLNGLFSATSVCDEHSLCVNTPGSYRCECKSGWKRSNNNDYCSDINECRDGGENNGNCTANSVCRNLPGSYECRCLQGFTEFTDGVQTCLDVDECKESKNAWS